MLRTRNAELFVEVQRADTKATALCGVAGGLLALIAGVWVTSPGGGPIEPVLMAIAVLLGSAVGTALMALRPVLPRGAAFGWGAAGVAQRTDVESLTHQEVGRLAVFEVLARRKFGAVRWSVDFVIAALAMAGMGLLIALLAP
ncbi:hypothetical protein [Streptomyces sp. NBC_01268]|uniref:hypothetical protein n=1 Tax=Streptomyces sp. NBC_01268 TaxID=2903806 RepID=UPI002E34D8A6|nr:hypothetical protein [Streptomyces sp. NBC_01268]